MLEDDQLYSVSEKRVFAEMDDRVALGWRRSELFIPVTQVKGQPMTYGAGKVLEG
jgi:hypothetical protein